MKPDLDFDRFLGCLSGLAAGDALGTTLEFKAPGTFEPVEDMVGGGPFGLEAGQWTDDTSMALCLAESLIETGGFDPADQMRRYVRWWRQGHLSSTGACFDIGNTIRAALMNFEATGEPFSGGTLPHSAGNGSIMRLAPVPLFFAGDPENAMEMAGESSRTTHGLPVCVDACRYMAAILVGALKGAAKEEILSSHYSPLAGYWNRRPLCPEIEEIAAGSFKDRQPPQIKGSGYVVKSLEAALWAFYHTADFSAGALKAVNLGDDADTTGAVYGQIAGAFYGAAGVPARWLARLALRERIEGFAERLWKGVPSGNG
jgi:ADP-ribosyl-[dinitrogen reductase] hydrolase